MGLKEADKRLQEIEAAIKREVQENIGVYFSGFKLVYQLLGIEEKLRQLRKPKIPLQSCRQ